MRHLLALFAILACALSARAADITADFTPDYLGTWTISSSVAAPWATGTPDKASIAESKRLSGAALEFRKDQIKGPQPFACKKPQYKFETATAEDLFEGSLTDAAKQAADLGFKRTTIPTLNTGCEIQFHFIDAGTALFGLNDRVYRLTRASEGHR